MSDDVTGGGPVCPRCANGRPTCTDASGNGLRHSHASTCATYLWANDLCANCDFEMSSSGDSKATR